MLNLTYIWRYTLYVSVTLCLFPTAGPVRVKLGTRTHTDPGSSALGKSRSTSEHERRRRETEAGRTPYKRGNGVAIGADSLGPVRRTAGTASILASISLKLAE